LWGSSSDQSLGGQAGAGLWEFAAYTDQVRFKADQTSSSMTDSDLPTIASGTSRAINGAASVLEFASDASWDVTTEGIANGSVSIRAELGSLLAGFNSDCGGSGAAVTASTLCIEESSSIMVDGWSAGTANEVSRRTRSFVPATVLEPLGRGLSLFGAIPVFQELSPLDDAFGRVDVTVLPLDRYENN